ncbi:hypothetical protein [Sorangium sp. So ce117]|uniref:hypothetical protein n=1 Tax=Sorangium sp. So ce117 TaxID=3133277 RepID=UPI003F5EE3DC
MPDEVGSRWLVHWRPVRSEDHLFEVPLVALLVCHHVLLRRISRLERRGDLLERLEIDAEGASASPEGRAQRVPGELSGDGIPEAGPEQIGHHHDGEIAVRHVQPVTAVLAGISDAG